MIFNIYVYIYISGFARSGPGRVRLFGSGPQPWQSIQTCLSDPSTAPKTTLCFSWLWQDLTSTFSIDWLVPLEFRPQSRKRAFGAILCFSCFVLLKKLQNQLF